MRVGTWNVNCWNPARREHKRALLELEEWDVVLLQEVGPETFACFVGGAGFSGVSALDLADHSSTRRRHGTAVLVRPPFRIVDAGLLPTDHLARVIGDVQPRHRARGMWATVADGERTLTVASVHTFNAAGKGEQRARRLARKMAQYRDLDSWVRSVTRPLVVGMDANAWLDVAGELELDETDPRYDQRRFLAWGADHGLRDVFVEHLRVNDPGLLERRRLLGAEGEDGALEVTYQRSAKGSFPKVNRMDRILASPELHVTDVRTLYADALTVGSDHALLIAELRPS